MKKLKLSLLSLALILGSCTNNPVESSPSSEEESVISSNEEKTSSSDISSEGTSSSKQEETSSVDETKVTNVRFIVKTINVDLRGTKQLEVKIYPSTAINRNVTFKVKDENIASVSSEGVVTGLNVGQTTVTVTTEDGGFSDTATINVIGEQATGIKIQVPEGTVQDSNGIYLLKVNQNLQLSYAISPSNSVNKVTWSSSTSSGDATSYLSVSKSGYLTARKVKVKITISVTTDNLFTDSVTFSVVKDSIYAKNYLGAKLEASKALEKENVVSGTKKIIHKKSKSYIDDVTNETFNIYSNGVSRTYTEEDHYLNRTKQYDGFYGIYDGYFYQLARTGNDYVSSSKTKIGDGEGEISSQLANEQSSLAFHRTHYSFGEIINEEYFSSTSYFEYTGDWQNFTFKEKNNVVTLDASYEKKASYYAETSYYRVLSLKVTFNNEGMVESFTFSSNDYDSSSYDFTSHSLKDNPTAFETYLNEFAQQTGTRTENTSFALYPSQCYFTSLTVGVYSSVGEGTINTLNVGDYLTYKATSYLPSTATSIIDGISYISSSDDGVVTYLPSGGLRAVGAGTCTLTFATSGGLTVTTDVNVTYKDVESIEIETNNIGVKVGETISDITISNEPYGSDPSCELSIVEGNEFATLSYSSITKTYSLTGVAEGKVVLEAVSSSNSSIKSQKTLYVYQELSENDVLQTLLTRKYKTTANNSKDYILVFQENGKGRVVDGFESYSTLYATFEYSINGFEIAVSNLTTLNNTILYSLGNLTLNSNGLEITGKLQTSSNSYTKKEYSFIRYE